MTSAEAPAARTIAIIGAGFCGAVTAASLLRSADAEPLDIVLINRSGPMARGLAYGTRTRRHLLNAPAARMGAFVDDAGDFLRYAQTRDPTITGATFVPRQLFGDYLEEVLASAVRQAAPQHRFRAVAGDVISLQVDPGDAPVRLRFADGRHLAADQVVLALGNFQPSDPRIPGGEAFFRNSARYVRDPWSDDALRRITSDRPVLTIGTGLTMIDVVLGLRAQGMSNQVLALSRHGLVPLAHRALDEPPLYRHGLPQRLVQAGTARGCLAELRREVREAAERGIDWRDVIGGLRAHTPRIWHALPISERRRFLRHLRPYWEVHRNRMAPRHGALLQAEVAADRLRPLAGRILAIEEQADSVRVRWRPRGGEEATEMEVGTVVNCTGPQSDTRRLQEPLLRRLREDGLIAPDALGLGLQTDERYALIDAQGRASDRLHYVGPFLRASHFEATAVPELRRHVAQLVQVLTSPAHTSSACNDSTREGSKTSNDKLNRY